MERSLADEKQHFADERIAHEETRTEYDATKDQLKAEQGAKEKAEEELKREKEAHESTKGQWRQEQEAHESTRGQWQQAEQGLKNLQDERNRLQEENERLHKAQEHYERAQQAFEQHDTREAKNQLYQALGEVPEYESASTEVAVDLLDDILSDLLTKVYQNNIEDQRKLLYEQLTSDASPAQVRATAKVLQRRWIEKPDILMDEFAHILELPRGIEAIAEMKQALVNAESDDQRMRLNAIRKIADAYCP